MDNKLFVKTLWKESKLSFFMGVYNIFTLAFFGSILILGKRLYPWVIKFLEKKVRRPWRPSVDRFKQIEYYAKIVVAANSKEDIKTLVSSCYTVLDLIRRETRFIILIDSLDKVCYVSIRGSHNERNWVDNFKGKQVYDKELKANIHEGYRAISKEIVNEIEKHISREYDLYIVGGSLGGVNAVLSGWYLITRGYSVIEIVNFAGPKLTSHDYSFLPVTHILHLEDPVIYLPLSMLVYHYIHQDDRIVIDGDDIYLYRDSWITDFLISIFGIKHKLRVDSHGEYPEVLSKFKKKLNY